MSWDWRRFRRDPPGDEPFYSLDDFQAQVDYITSPADQCDAHWVLVRTFAVCPCSINRTTFCSVSITMNDLMITDITPFSFFVVPTTDFFHDVLYRSVGLPAWVCRSAVKYNLFNLSHFFHFFIISQRRIRFAAVFNDTAISSSVCQSII